MRQVREEDITGELAFAKKAAAHFAGHPEHWTFTDGEVVSGALLALRWGLGNDCVLVVRIDDSHEPTIYAQQIRLATQP